MVDADDFDVESLRRLLRGESCPAPAPPQKERKAAPKKAAAAKPAAKKPAARKATPATRAKRAGR